MGYNRNVPDRILRHDLRYSTGGQMKRCSVILSETDVRSSKEVIGVGVSYYNKPVDCGVHRVYVDI